jgi:hypothetical protein
MTSTTITSAAALIAISDYFGINTPYEILENLMKVHNLKEIARFPCILVRPNSEYWHGGVLLGFGETPDRSYDTPPSVKHVGPDQSTFSNATLGIPALLLTLFQITPGTGSPAGNYVFLPEGNRLYRVNELFEYTKFTLE